MFHHIEAHVVATLYKRADVAGYALLLVHRRHRLAVIWLTIGGAEDAAHHLLRLGQLRLPQRAAHTALLLKPSPPAVACQGSHHRLATVLRMLLHGPLQTGIELTLNTLALGLLRIPAHHTVVVDRRRHVRHQRPQPVGHHRQRLRRRLEVQLRVVAHATRGRQRLAGGAQFHACQRAVDGQCRLLAVCQQAFVVSTVNRLATVAEGHADDDLQRAAAAADERQHGVRHPGYAAPDLSGLRRALRTVNVHQHQSAHRALVVGAAATEGAAEQQPRQPVGSSVTHTGAYQLHRFAVLL